MISKQIIYFGQTVILICDGKCHKAWGLNERPEHNEDTDESEYYLDNELDESPSDPGTYEGGVSKPTEKTERLNKWCARECERSVIVKPCEDFELPEF